MKRKESDIDLFEGLDDLDDGIPEAKKLKLSDDDDLRMEVEPAIGAYPQNTDSAEARPGTTFYPLKSHFFFSFIIIANFIIFCIKKHQLAVTMQATRAAQSLLKIPRLQCLEMLCTPK